MRTVSALLLIATLTPPLTAADPVTLRWGLKEGDRFYSTTTLTQDHTLDVKGQKVESTLDVRFTLAYRVKSVREGETVVEVTYLDARIDGTGVPGVPGAADKVRGATITLVVDDDHVLTQVHGHEKIVRKFRDAADEERDAAEALFGEAGVRELVGLPFAVLPRKGLRVGEAVTRDENGMMSGLAMTGKTTSKLEQVKDGVARVGTTSDLTIKAGSDGPPLPGAKLDLRTERAAGGYTFDLGAHRLKEYAHATTIRGTVTAPVEGKHVTLGITLRQKQTVVISDTAPRED